MVFAATGARDVVREVGDLGGHARSHEDDDAQGSGEDVTHDDLPLIKGMHRCVFGWLERHAVEVRDVGDRHRRRQVDLDEVHGGPDQELSVPGGTVDSGTFGKNPGASTQWRRFPTRAGRRHDRPRVGVRDQPEERTLAEDGGGVNETNMNPDVAVGTPTPGIPKIVRSPVPGVVCASKTYGPTVM